MPTSKRATKLNVVEKITTLEGGTQFRVRKSFPIEESKLAVEWLKNHLTRNPCYIIGNNLKMEHIEKYLKSKEHETNPLKKPGVFVLED